VRTAATVLGVALLAASVEPVASAAADVSLDLSPATVEYRQPVTLSGVLSAGVPCRAGREVSLERRLPAATDWEPAGSALTGPDGSFGFVLRPTTNASYRAVALGEVREGTQCQEAVSAERSSRVRARVTLPLGDLELRASRCRGVPVRVLPAKPGAMVEVQRLVGSGWRTEGTAVLDQDSRARVPVCARWTDLGRMTLRGRWPRQDDHNLLGTGPERLVPVVRAAWMRTIDRLTAGRAIGVSVREGGTFVYRRADTVRRTPASNQKLLLSMALLERLPAEARFPTAALGRLRPNGVLRGDLWIAGRGDPEVGPGTLRRLARRLRDAGLRRVAGSVRGSTRFYARDWWARGWRPYFPSRVIALPSALTFRGNRPNGRHVADPERHAARELTRRLRRLGIPVRGAPGMGAHPGGIPEVTRVRSRPLDALLVTTNKASANFHAEVLGKRLGVEASGAPGSIGKGAAAMSGWAGSRGVGVQAHDASGLSYANRATPAGMARLLEAAEARPWGETLRGTLPTGGEGTLRTRLRGEPVRAKTGTLSSISALSGWVLADRTGTWVEFSIMGSGSTRTLKAIEDRIVRILRRQAA
jgi:serine-type D-Ala-D-Ala carboxypeptidase/endopeptidase (penicillin-binding protein 4)